MKWLLWVLIFAVLSVGTALADRYPAKPECSLLSQLAQGFEVTGGFRWDFTEACPVQRCRKSHELDNGDSNDTPFAGANLRLPYGEYGGFFISGDRDLTDAPRGNLRVGIYFAPWRTQ